MDGCGADTPVRRPARSFLVGSGVCRGLVASELLETECPWGPCRDSGFFSVFTADLRPGLTAVVAARLNGPMLWESWWKRRQGSRQSRQTQGAFDGVRLRLIPLRMTSLWWRD